MATADELKALGNKAIGLKNYDEAIEKFSAAIELAPENHILYSNRSAAYASKKSGRDWDLALADAERTTQIKPDWAKGWGRKGDAHWGKGDLEAAAEAYAKGLELDPNNAGMKNNLASVRNAMTAEEPMGGDGAGLGKMFSDPNIISKLRSNPKTASFVDDPSFMLKLQMIQANPGNMQGLFEDPRMIQVLGVLMGVEMDLRSPDDPLPAGAQQMGSFEREEDVAMPDARPAPAKAAPPPKSPSPELSPEEAEEKRAEAEAKAAADKEKALGTENYKKRNFDEAIKHYQAAWDLHKDITYLNNLGAAQFEKGDFAAAIEACQKAVDESMGMRVDFTTVAKSYARIGTAHERLGDLEKAIENYKLSLRENRKAPDVLKKLSAAEKLKKEKDRQAQIDPEKAKAAKEEGNAKFTVGDFPGAQAAYTEMIKRNPDDPVGYSNRAAAYMKLMAFPSALNDCDEAIKRDPKFIKAYLRKAQAYFGMREYSKCLDLCKEASEVDKEHWAGKNAREIEAQQQKAFSAMYSARENETEDQTRERLQRDPEIMGIMQDPVMQAILQQAQSDPAALNEHMKNPDVRAKVQKLVAAGVIRMGR